LPRVITVPSLVANVKYHFLQLLHRLLQFLYYKRHLKQKPFTKFSRICDPQQRVSERQILF
jgi:hypothetical protein